MQGTGSQIPKNLITEVHVDSSESEKRPFSHIFMNLAIQLSHRTADVHTGVGCVLVNTSNQILGIGYNGESKESSVLDANHNANELMVHAEMNALIHSSVNLMKEEIYVFTTRQPCEQCMKSLAQYNIKGIFYLTYGGYKSFMIAERKRIPMVQYDCVFKFEFDGAPLKDSRYNLVKQEIELLTAGEVQYSSPPTPPKTSTADHEKSSNEETFTTSGVEGSELEGRSGKASDEKKPCYCSTHRAQELKCSECESNARRERLPEKLRLPHSIYSTWVRDFKVKEKWRVLK